MNMEYTPLVDTASPRASIVTIDDIPHNEINHNEFHCHLCKTKYIKKQQSDHTPIECLSQRYRSLEKEVIRLKDHDLKSRLKTKELENTINSLTDAIKGLTSPKQEQAAPYSFGLGHKRRNILKKSYSEDVPTEKLGVNYDNIIQSTKPNNQKRVGLFGSLGATSQQ